MFESFQPIYRVLSHGIGWGHLGESIDRQVGEEEHQCLEVLIVSTSWDPVSLAQSKHQSLAIEVNWKLSQYFFKKFF